MKKIHKIGRRARRMPLESELLMCRGDQAWTSEIQDLSATGLMASRPSNWHGIRGDEFVLDMLIGDTLSVHLQATVMRIDEGSIGFAFSHIPAEKEEALWNLLGGYADSLELWRDDDEKDANQGDD